MTQAERDANLETLLEFLRERRGFDFTGYKRASLTRRIQKRMEQVGVTSYRDYIDVLEAHPDEFAQLFDTILINVTSFFRDDLPWQFLQQEVVPRIVEGAEDDQFVRVWSAGCATGQEAYSLAMVFAERMGVEQFRDRVKIYATDLDEHALSAARLGTYTEREVESVPAELRERYFERTDGNFTFRRDLRRSVIFGRNDLIQDAPISRIALLVCRNTLMYFDAETQQRILSRFHFALRDEGLLFLGRAETLLNRSSLFVPVDLKRRVFRKVPHRSFRDRLLVAARSTEHDPLHGVTRATQLREAAFAAGGVAQVVVSDEGRLVMANNPARVIFQLEPLDLGRPFAELELSYRPADLRSLIDLADAERRTVSGPEVEWRTATGETMWLEIRVTPLRNEADEPLGASIAFLDITGRRAIAEQLRQSTVELESAYEELQSTNEELETTNEELQSTVEELETTNEELQSTNEELETMNEELQSANEELQTMNDELRRRGDEVHEVNAFLESIFTSVRSGVVVLDRELRVLVWNAQSENLWGLRADEVENTPFLSLDSGLPVEQLKQPLRACVLGDVPAFEREVTATNRRGRPVVCRVRGTPLVSSKERTPRGVLLIVDCDEGGDRPSA